MTMTATDQDTARENAALLEQLLTEPRSSSFMHWFVMVALEEYCERVLKIGERGLGNPLIDPKDWVACAQEAQEAVQRWKL